MMRFSSIIDSGFPVGGAVWKRELDPQIVFMFQTGHGGADEDGPAGLAERHAVRVPDIQVL